MVDPAGPPRPERRRCPWLLAGPAALFADRAGLVAAPAGAWPVVWDDSACEAAVVLGAEPEVAPVPPQAPTDAAMTTVMAALRIAPCNPRPSCGTQLICVR